MEILTEHEIDSLTALVDCLIPSDSFGPSASQAGVVDFIKGQLSGEYGAGKRMYLGADDAHQPGVADQVFLAPLDRYRVGLAALDERALTMAGSRFPELSHDDRVRLLKDVERESDDRSVTKTFFNQVLENTMEGYFSDPIHGGNRFAAAWKMVGFPGCGHDYRFYVGKNVAVADLVPVQSIALFRKAADA